jgi:deoxyribodipyrimidine photo-lyase
VTAILWFTRDLRAHDHPALRAALDSCSSVVPVFCLDDRLLAGRHASGPRTQFMLECLAELRERMDGQLVIRRGAPERELAELARSVGATELHFSADSGPFARRRIERVKAAVGIECFEHPGLHAIDDLDELRTGAGKPYTVFTPFHRKWLQAPRRHVIGAPQSFGSLPRGVRIGRMPSLDSLGLEQEVERPMKGGEEQGRERLARFLRSGVRSYRDTHDAVPDDATSRLSAYLHFGCLSPREIESRLPGGVGAQELRRQLCWRDFYHHVLLNFPRDARSEFQERYRGAITWSRAEGHFEAWREGRTGFPLVDAGCVSCAPRAGCTTARSSSSARS